MRDTRFIAAHRGGLLSMESHRDLICWAVECVRHGIQTLQLKEIDERALNALEIALKWAQGNATVGEARDAAVKAHNAARETPDSVAQAVYRACGHAVATAHMADHSLQARAYILKAFEFQKIDIESEKDWHIQHANIEIRTLITPPLRVRD